MRKILTIALCLAATPLWAQSNQEFCADMDAQDKLDGHEARECVCIMEVADEMLDPAIKAVFQTSMAEDIQGMEVMNQMMAIAPLEVLMPQLEAYNSALGPQCNVWENQ